MTDNRLFLTQGGFSLKERRFLAGTSGDSGGGGGGGGGDTNGVRGPSHETVNHSVTRWLGTNGKQITDSKVIIDENGAITAPSLITSTILAAPSALAKARGKKASADSVVNVEGKLSVSKTVNASAYKINNEQVLASTKQNNLGNISVGTLMSQPINVSGAVSVGNEAGGPGFSGQVIRHTVSVGAKALSRGTTGHNNIAVGYQTIGGTGSTSDPFAGRENVVVGTEAMRNSVGGDNSVAVGFRALLDNDGDNNVAIGHRAGIRIKTGSGNIHIGNEAPSDESNVIRIGDGQTMLYVAGTDNALVNTEQQSIIAVNNSGRMAETNFIQVSNSNIQLLNDITIGASGDKIGFFGLATSVVQQNVDTSVDTATTLANLITALVNYGMITKT